MPYKVKRNIVFHKVKGRWKIKQRAKSHQKALAAERLLRGIAHGWKPRRRRRHKKIW